MLKRILVTLIILAGFIFYFPAMASEDSGEYPFPEDFSFDDLPDIDLEDTTPVETSKVENTSPMAVTNVDDKTPINTSNTVIPSDDINAVEVDNILRNDENAEEDKDNIKEKIFIPSKNSEEDIDNSFDKEKSLTETLKETSSHEEKKDPLKGTWMEKISTSNPLSLLGIKENEDDNSEDGESQLKNLIKNARNKGEKGKSNASVFDISGIMLRMDLKQVEKTLQNRGFRKINAKFQIPNFIKWRNEETCRNEGVVGYERLEACVISKAKKGGYEYLQYIKYAKFDSKEEIEVYFTSNFTENKVYKITYNSRIADITGNSPKAIYIRNIKVYDFWKKINQKYGHPDNKTTVTWGMGEDKPYLKASTGFLLLEDPMFREMDYTRMSREDQRFINSDFYNF